MAERLPMKLWETGGESVNELVERFTAQEDLALDEALARYDILGSLAHATMLQKIRLLSAAEFARLGRALCKLLSAAISLTVQDEDIHTKIENLLVEELGELGQKLHTGRSRNDQILVDLRLYTKDKLLEIALAALELAARLHKFAQQHEFVPMPGYTHTRRAMPSSVGLWAAAFAESLLDDLKLLATAYELNDRSPLGAAAGYGVPLNIDRQLTAKLLGFSRVQRNALAVMNSRGKLEFAVVSSLSGLMLSVGRLANDLIWYSSEEFGFFRIADAFCTGSSLMPNKSNPDVLELMRARVAGVVSALNQLLLIVHGLTSGYHRDLQETKGPLMRSLATTCACLKIMSPLVVALQVDHARLEAACSAELFAVDSVIKKVQEGVPFRQAYRNVKRELSSLKVPHIEAALKQRQHTGGSGNLQLTGLQKEIERERARWRSQHERFVTALKKLKHITTKRGERR